MMKKSIYIELNNVLRDIISKTILVYKADNLEKKLEDEYTGQDLQEYLGFETKEELIEYMYVECPMRIFGYSNECEEGTSFMINEFYKKYRDNYDVVLFSNEIEKSKPATLMFLARMGILIDNIEFFPLEDFESVNKKADIIITNNLNITKYKKTKYIKINKEEYNKENKASNYRENVLYVSSIKDLVEDEYIERNEFA
tara:strand:- start:19 stop:615 length:597 start_codon:yes stop_codon:yes gene_type:complete